ETGPAMTLLRHRLANAATMKFAAAPRPLNHPFLVFNDTGAQVAAAGQHDSPPHRVTATLDSKQHHHWPAVAVLGNGAGPSRGRPRAADLPLSGVQRYGRPGRGLGSARQPLVSCHRDARLQETSYLARSC